jgi:hypothetical protein
MQVAKDVLPLALRCFRCSSRTCCGKRSMPTEPNATQDLNDAIRSFGRAWAAGDTVVLRDMLPPSYTHIDVRGRFLSHDEWLRYVSARYRSDDFRSFRGCGHPAHPGVRHGRANRCRPASAHLGHLRSGASAWAATHAAICLTDCTSSLFGQDQSSKIPPRSSEPRPDRLGTATSESRWHREGAIRVSVL